MLTPADIDSKDFTPTRFKEGYSATEVDDYLDAVVVTVENLTVEKARLADENERLKARLSIVQRQLDAYGGQPTLVGKPLTATSPEFVGQLGRILDVAQQSADEQIAEAKSEAARIAYDAQVRAGQMVTEAEAKVADMARKLEEIEQVRKSTHEFVTQHLVTLKNNMESPSE